MGPTCSCLYFKRSCCVISFQIFWSPWNRSKIPWMWLFWSDTFDTLYSAWFLCSTQKCGFWQASVPYVVHKDHSSGNIISALGNMLLVFYIRIYFFEGTYIAQNDEDGYFWDIAKRGSNLQSLNPLLTHAPKTTVIQNHVFLFWGVLSIKISFKPSIKFFGG